MKKQGREKKTPNCMGYLSGLGRPEVESLIQFHAAEASGWICAVSLYEVKDVSFSLVVLGSTHSNLRLQKS